MKNKRLILLLSGVGLILLIPLIAMIFTSEVKWGLFDFAIMLILLTGTALTIEFILRKVKRTTSRILLCAGVLLVLLLIWAELAVGIFGSPLAGS